MAERVAVAVKSLMEKLVTGSSSTVVKPVKLLLHNSAAKLRDD